MERTPHPDRPQCRHCGRTLAGSESLLGALCHPCRAHSVARVLAADAAAPMLEPGLRAELRRRFARAYLATPPRDRGSMLVDLEDAGVNISR